MERQENTPSYGFTKAQPKSNQQPGGIARKLIIKPLKCKFTLRFFNYCALGEHLAMPY